MGQREVQLEPVSQVLDLATDGRGHGLGERDVLVDGLDLQDPGLAVGGGIELAHQPVVVQDRQREVSPPALGVGGAFIFEMILTAIFVFVILRVTSSTGNPATAAIAIGLTLTVVHLVGIPITGTSVNPARSLGPALVVAGTALSQVWLFIVAPLVGGVLAAGLHRLFYRGEDAALAREAQQADTTEGPVTS